VIPSPGSPLTWVARDASKPGRAAAPEAWVAHADPAWSDAHLERAADEVAARLLEALGAALGRELPAPQHLRAHRWRHARADRVLGAPCLVAADGRVGVAGDACLAPRAEAAFVSGRALARALQEALA
jgi:predicted NAD/FAD-dependent oxidoreductase